MHVRRALALSLVTPLLLAGCSDGGEPEADPTPKMPETSSTTPSPSETVEEESPEEFIRRWVEAGDRMQVTGDTAAYKEMSPNCKPCLGFVKNVDAVYEAGGSAEFAGTEITRIRKHAPNPPTFDVRQEVPETVIRRSSDAPPQTLPAGSTEIRVILKRAGESWKVTYFGILS